MILVAGDLGLNLEEEIFMYVASKEDDSIRFLFIYLDPKFLHCSVDI